MNLWLFDTRRLLFEISLSILLLFRGLRGAKFMSDQLQGRYEVVK